jgi:hypothetical protein
MVAASKRLERNLVRMVCIVCNMIKEGKKAALPPV